MVDYIEHRKPVGRYCPTMPLTQQDQAMPDDKWQDQERMALKKR